MAKGNYKEQNIEFLKKKATEEGVHKTAQGVLYEVLNSTGSCKKATVRNIVSVYYKGTAWPAGLIPANAWHHGW